MASLRKCPGPKPGKRNSLGGKIRQLRESADYNRTQFTILLQKRGWDIDRATLIRLEQGTRTIADFELEFLLKTLRVDWTVLGKP